MTRIRKIKRRKRFQANVNRKRLRNKLYKLPTIGCKQIKNAWEVKKSVEGNLKDMGLSYDPNKTLKIPNSKRQALETIKNEVVATANFSEEDIADNKHPLKAFVAEDLEKEAKAPRERMFKLPKSQVQFVTYMMDKYGDDYKAMTRDKKNYYQLTWRQMRAKVNTFKNIPEQYAEYLLKKGEIVLDDPVSLEETKKQRALENYQKHCVSKKPKKALKISVGWEEESITPAEKLPKASSLLQKKDGSDSANKKELSLMLDESEDERKVKKVSKKKQKQETVDEASNGVLQSKLGKSTNKEKGAKNDLNSSITAKVTEKRKADDRNENSKRIKKLEKLPSSDSDTEEELEGEDNSEFVNLSDLSSEELSDIDTLDDGQFVTSSEDESA